MRKRAESAIFRRYGTDSLWNVAATCEDTVATGYMPTLAGR